MWNGTDGEPPEVDYSKVRIIDVVPDAARKAPKPTAELMTQVRIAIGNITETPNETTMRKVAQYFVLLDMDVMDVVHMPDLEIYSYYDLLLKLMTANCITYAW